MGKARHNKIGEKTGKNKRLKSEKSRKGQLFQAIGLLSLLRNVSFL